MLRVRRCGAQMHARRVLLEDHQGLSGRTLGLSDVEVGLVDQDRRHPQALEFSHSVPLPNVPSDLQYVRTFLHLTSYKCLTLPRLHHVNGLVPGFCLLLLSMLSDD